jgi:signal transduction histidine kinase
MALVLIRDDERQRLRRDIHDGLGSYLAGIGFALEGVRRQLPEPQSAQLARIAEQAAAATHEVRRILEDLRPGPLEQLGLLDALRELAERATGAGGLTVAVSCPAALPSAPLPVELAAYRIASEALTNVIRHAGAAHCDMSVAVDGSGLRIVVSDDGLGAPASAGTGVGLGSMRARAESVGGAVTVAARPERGTIVCAELPWGLPA